MFGRMRGHKCTRMDGRRRYKRIQSTTADRILWKPYHNRRKEMINEMKCMSRMHPIWSLHINAENMWIKVPRRNQSVGCCFFFFFFLFPIWTQFSSRRKFQIIYFNHFSSISHSISCYVVVQLHHRKFEVMQYNWSSASHLSACAVVSVIADILSNIIEYLHWFFLSFSSICLARP